jgi:cyclopropane fatty-acyl-phospholipid synthase-like methyltransferase
MNTSYQFDYFENELMKSEIKRLTANVDSHSEALTRLFLENGLYGAKKVLDVGCGTEAMINLFSNFLRLYLFS